MGGYAGTSAAQVGAKRRGRKEKRTIGFLLYISGCVAAANWLARAVSI